MPPLRKSLRSPRPWPPAETMRGVPARLSPRRSGTWLPTGIIWRSTGSQPRPPGGDSGRMREIPVGRPNPQADRLNTSKEGRTAQWQLLFWFPAAGVADGPASRFPPGFAASAIPCTLLPCRAWAMTAPTPTPAPSISTPTSRHVVQAVTAVGPADDRGPVVLCGHSYAGMVITAAADRAADQVQRLVYLDAFVPDDGQSWWTWRTTTTARWCSRAHGKTA